MRRAPRLILFLSAVWIALFLITSLFIFLGGGGYLGHLLGSYIKLEWLLVYFFFIALYIFKNNPDSMQY